MKKKIGVDLDSVLAELTPRLLDFHNETYGTTLVIDDCIDYRLWLIWGCSKEESLKRVYEFYKSKYMDATTPIKGSVEGIKYLAKKYDLYLITSRPTWLEKKTVDWMEKHFPGIFEKIILTNQVSSGEENKTKSEVGRKIGITHLIEDHMEYMMDAHENGIKVLLRDTPWNRNESLPEDVVRFYDWKEVSNYL